MPDSPDPRPLTERARRFAELFAGNGADAAARAGYQGDRASLAVTASRLRRDPRVVEIIEARRARSRPRPTAGKADGPQGAREPSAGPGPTLDPPASEGPQGAATSGDEPIEVLRELMTDTSVNPSTRARIAELLARRDDRAAGVDADPFESLRASQRAAQALRRERDRTDPATAIAQLATRLAKAHPEIARELRAVVARHAPRSPGPEGGT